MPGSVRLRSEPRQTAGRSSQQPAFRHQLETPQLQHPALGEMQVCPSKHAQHATSACSSSSCPHPEMAHIKRWACNQRAGARHSCAIGTQHTHAFACQAS
eukprot:3843514-Alexandrium_andersonii.AAC.1